jgi:hypothetical protein
VHEGLKSVFFAGEQSACSSMIGKTKGRIRSYMGFEIELDTFVLNTKVDTLVTDLNPQHSIHPTRGRGIEVRHENPA